MGFSVKFNYSLSIGIWSDSTCLTYQGYQELQLFCPDSLLGKDQDYLNFVGTLPIRLAQKALGLQNPITKKGKDKKRLYTFIPKVGECYLGHQEELKTLKNIKNVQILPQIRSEIKQLKKEILTQIKEDKSKCLKGLAGLQFQSAGSRFVLTLPQKNKVRPKVYFSLIKVWDELVEYTPPDIISRAVQAIKAFINSKADVINGTTYYLELLSEVQNDMPKFIINII